MSRKPALWLLAWLLPLPICVSATAPVAAQTLDDIGRPLSPAEGRALNAEIIRLARVNGVQIVTLKAIARAIGLKSRNIDFDQLIKQVGAGATRLAELKAEIGALKSQIAKIQTASVRDPATAALARAQAALDAGRLDEADREFASLESLRKIDLALAQTAWINAVDARANVAELRQDYDLAEQLRLAKGDFLIEQSRRTTREAWQSKLDAAEGRFKEGQLKADSAVLRRAVNLYRDQVLPLAPRLERPLDWAYTQNDLGATLSLLGQLSDDMPTLLQSLETINLAIAELDYKKLPLQWSKAQINLSGTLFMIGTRDDNRSLSLENAEKKLEFTLQILTREQSPTDWAAAQNNLGAIYMALGERENGTVRLEKAASAMKNALSVFTREREPFEWVGTTINRVIPLAIIAERKQDVKMLDQAEQNMRDACVLATEKNIELAQSLCAVIPLKIKEVREKLANS
jgi:hypothetical protein